MTSVPPPTFAILRDHRHIALTTYRRGRQPIITPVWFLLLDDRVYLWTTADSGPAARLRASARVQFAPSDEQGGLLGPTLDGVARFLPEPEWPRLAAQMEAKYGWAARLRRWLWRLQRRLNVYVEITAA